MCRENNIMLTGCKYTKTSNNASEIQPKLRASGMGWVRAGVLNIKCTQNKLTRKLFNTGLRPLYKQEAHGPRVTHLSDIATADMQMLCNIFPVLSSQLMKRSTFKQFLILKKNIIYGMTVNGA